MTQPSFQESDSYAFDEDKFSSLSSSSQQKQPYNEKTPSLPSVHHNMYHCYNPGTTESWTGLRTISKTYHIPEEALKKLHSTIGDPTTNLMNLSAQVQNQYVEALTWLTFPNFGPSKNKLKITT